PRPLFAHAPPPHQTYTLSLHDALPISVYYPNDTHWTDEGSVAMTMTLVENLRPGLTQGWRVVPGGAYTSSADLPKMIGREGSKTSISYSVMPDGQTNRTTVLALDIDRPVRRQQPAVPGTITEPTLVFG